MLIERESAHKVTNLEKEALSLALREKKLEEDINKLRTEVGIIEEIKQKFSVTREGEHVAIIVNERSKATSSATSTIEWFKESWQSIKNLWSTLSSGYNSSQ